MNDLSLHRPGTYNLEAAERRSSLDYSRMASRPPTPSFWQRLFPRDPYTRMAIVWSFTQFVIISILEGMVLKKQDDYVNTMATAKFPPDSIIVPNARALIVYQALFICAQAFQLFLTTDAIFSLSVIQMLATTAFNGALFVYSIVQYSQAANILTAADMVILKLSIPGIEIHPTKTLELIIIGLMAVFMIGWVFLTFKLYKIFGWTIYKEMGADVSVMSKELFYIIHKA